MIALNKSIESGNNWNIYISQDENGYFRKDITTDIKYFAYLSKLKRWRIVAGLEELTSEEKNACFGFYNGKKVDFNNLDWLVKLLNAEIKLKHNLDESDIQKVLNHVYKKICSVRY